MSKAKTNPHRGGSFESFLAEEGILEEVTMAATKRVLARRVLAMKQQRVSKAAMARRMRTSRAAVDRLLDAENTSGRCKRWAALRRFWASSCRSRSKTQPKLLGTRYPVAGIAAWASQEGSSLT